MIAEAAENTEPIYSIFVADRVGIWYRSWPNGPWNRNATPPWRSGWT